MSSLYSGAVRIIPASSETSRMAPVQSSLILHAAGDALPDLGIVSALEHRILLDAILIDTIEEDVNIERLSHRITLRSNFSGVTIRGYSDCGFIGL